MTITKDNIHIVCYDYIDKCEYMESAIDQITAALETIGVKWKTKQDALIWADFLGLEWLTFELNKPGVDVPEAVGSYLNTQATDAGTVARALSAASTLNDLFPF
jgi:hypothetical protein